MKSLNLSPEERVNTDNPSRFNVPNIFKRDYKYYEGVPRINIYLLRLLFTLVALFVTYDAWQHIINHRGPWDPVDAAAWCMWGAYSVLSVIGIFRPLKMLPIVIFEIIYKIIWLIVVAYPLWATGALAGSPAEAMTQAFLWVILPIVAMPWGYFFRTYILGRRLAGGK